MACSPVPKVGGAAAPSAPPVPTSMYVPSSYYASKLSTAVSSLLLRDYCLCILGVGKSPSSTPITLSVEEFKSDYPTPAVFFFYVYIYMRQLSLGGFL